MKIVSTGPISFSNLQQFVLIAGPCSLESLDHAIFMVRSLKEIANRYEVPFIFKSSFDKANRTGVNGLRGVGEDEGIEIFKKIKQEFNIPIITDVHNQEQCQKFAKVVDILQIPAFLCRQTDLLKSAAETGKVINVKKGQFLAPWDMSNIVKKLESFGCYNMLLCERGVSFGYNKLISDMRSLPIMAKTGYPVIFDATHSVQEPGGNGESSGGNRVFAPILGRAALAVGVAGIFAEVHENPDNALSDGPNMIKLNEFEEILKEWIAIDKVSKKMIRNLGNFF